MTTQEFFRSFWVNLVCWVVVGLIVLTSALRFPDRTLGYAIGAVACIALVRWDIRRRMKR